MNKSKQRKTAAVKVLRNGTMAQSRNGKRQRRAWLLPCLLLLLSLLTERVSCQQSLLDGFYTTSTDVESELNFALDIAEMREVQDGSGNDDEDKQRDIYTNGMHSKIKGPDGTETLRSLASLSLNAETVMKDDFMYNLYRKAFFDLGVRVEEETPGDFDDEPASQYANTIVNDLFSLQLPGIETEAALALNVWMAVAHELWEFLRACHRNNSNSPQEMNLALDKAAALWIGQGQVRGDAERGQLLYNLAEKAGRLFNQNDDGPEVMANHVIVSSLVELQEEVENGTCQDGMQGVKEVRDVVQIVLGYMTVPLVQHLIHHIRQIGNGGDERDFIELYALSIMPQVAYCDPTAHDKMVEFFVTGTITESDRDDAIAVVQSAYSCMLVTCDMVGAYMEGEVEQCKDVPDTPKAYAGYQPTHDAIQYAYIDRDIAQFRVLMEEGAYHAAQDLYHHGRNSRPGSEYLSLHFLATFDGRNIVPNVDIFSDYFDVEGEDGFLYADNIISKVVTQQGLYQDLAPQILTEIGVGALQYMVMYVAVLHKLDAAMERCTNNETADAIESWDQAAALFVGSIEGEDESGSAKGYGELLFGAGKFFCQLFDTCIDGTAKMNQDVMAAFDVGRVNIRDGECESAIQDVIFMGQDLLVPLVQGTLHYAVLTAPLAANADDAILGTGHILAQSIIPLVDDIDEPSGTAIDDNTNVLGRTGPTDYTAVFNAFKTAIDNGLEVDCDVMGVYTAFPDTDGDVCKSDQVATPGTPTPPSPPTGSPPPTQPPELGFGRYPFANTDNPYALLAHDIRDMIAGDVEDARQVYTQGKNAVFQGGDGEGTTTLSISKFSTEASEEMAQDPMYNTFRFALQDEDVFNERSSATYADGKYADITVTKALDSGILDLAANAAITLNIWMSIANHLYEAIRNCKAGISDVSNLDNALAMWIGVDQTEASLNGWLLYAFAEQAAGRFQALKTEAPVNKKLIELFNEANDLIGTCSSDGKAYLVLRYVVMKILPQMTIPLIQEFLHQIQLGSANGNYVTLYALSFVPQVAACNPSAFLDLKNVLIDDDYDSFELAKVEPVLASLQPIMGCLRITCDDLQLPREQDGSFSAPFEDFCDGQADGIKAIVGYTPSTDVNEYSRIDLDMLQMQILMETEAYDAAMDLYVHGYNSMPNGELFSLQKLAKDPNPPGGPAQFDLFKNYFNGTETYADDMVMEVFDGSGRYNGASRQQKTEAVVLTIETLAMYMSVVKQLFIAVNKCDEEVDDFGMSEWDIGVAWFVGSIEGQVRGGAVKGGGQLLYGLGKEMCESFSTCEISGNAAVNERLTGTFVSGKSLLSQGECASALSLITMDMLPVLPVPLIQGTLKYAKLNEELEAGSTSQSLASGFVLSRSVLPLVNNSSQASAKTISTNMDFQLTEKPVKDGSIAVFTAFSDALPGMAVDCVDIGTPLSDPSRSVCGEGSTPSPTPNPVETPTELSSGLYTTTTYVQDRANIALDVRDMEKHLTNGNVNLAKLIYTAGDNSQVFNENGIKTGQRSLSGFSLSSTLEMKDEPIFNIVLYALQDNNGNYLGKEARVYADSIVLEAFSNMNPSAKTLASEAAVVLNVWMFVVHELYQTLDRCKSKDITDVDGVHSIDEVAAYWIGDGQQTGDAEKGHLLYALTEKHGELFNLDEGGQTKTNTNILKLLNQAKKELTSQNACSDDLQTFSSLFQIVNRMVPLMTVPLIQGLIHNLKQGDRDRVKLYAQAFVPLVAGCNPDTFDYLSDKLISLNYNVVEMDEIIEMISSTYMCFGLKCEDIGSYSLDDRFSCADPPEASPLAGYRPETNVQQYSLIDLDILEIDILLKMEAYGAAEDLYTHGKHAFLDGVDGQTLSLHGFATSSDRMRVPRFESYERYYNDDKYADTIIKRGFDLSRTAISAEQRRALVVKTCQYMVVYMMALAALYESREECSSNSPNAEASWDKAAALLIGSLEGTKDAGSDQGLLHHGLAKQRCTQFGTCTREPHNAEVNERVIELLYAGRAELTAQSCDSLGKGISEIESLLLVPLIQSTLRYAIANMDANLFSRDGNLAEGYVFSRSILPLVEDANRESASVLAKHMDLGDETPDRNAGAVFDALAQAYTGMGVDCNLVGGTADGVSACSGSEGLEDDSGLSAGETAGIVIGSLCAVGLIAGAAVYARKMRKQQKTSTETTSLVTNEAGVLDAEDVGLGPVSSPQEKPTETTSFVRNTNGVMDDDHDDGEEEVDVGELPEGDPDEANSRQRFRGVYETDEIV